LQETDDYLNVLTTVPDNWTEFGSQALNYAMEKLKSGDSEFGWWTYLPIHKGENKLIGSSGYKGNPNENGEVEIGYEIKSEYRNKGLATELVKVLVQNAFNFETVNTVQAHTLGEVNRSTKILSKSGFQMTNEIENKENGTLWKWELKREG